VGLAGAHPVFFFGGGGGESILEGSVLRGWLSVLTYYVRVFIHHPRHTVVYCTQR